MFILFQHLSMSFSCRFFFCCAISDILITNFLPFPPSISLASSNNLVKTWSFSRSSSKASSSFCFLFCAGFAGTSSFPFLLYTHPYIKCFYKLSQSSNNMPQYLHSMVFETSMSLSESSASVKESVGVIAFIPLPTCFVFGIPGGGGRL